MYHIDSVIVSVLTSSSVDLGFDHGQV